MAGRTQSGCVELASKARPHRLGTLDALRGVAALAILLRHYPWPNDEVLLFPRSHLAVDLFFVLSGFVIAHAYQSRLAGGMPLRSFVSRRLIRLYPLYAIATLIGAGTALADLGNNGNSHRKWLVTLIAAGLFLPTPVRWSTDAASLFPFDYSAWSLLWELAINLVFALLARWLRPRLLIGVIGIAAVLLVGTVIFAGDMDGGSDLDTMWIGAARAPFSFFAGVGIYRLRRFYPAPRLPGGLLCALLLAAFSVPHASLDWPYELGCAMLLFPLIVWLGAEAALGPHGERVADLIGWLSYPTYVLELPLLALITLLLQHLNGWRISDSIVRGMPIYLGVVLVAAWVLARWFDEPLRAWLGQRLIPASTSGRFARSS